MNNLTKALEQKNTFIKTIKAFIDSQEFNPNFGQNWYEFANKDIDSILGRFYPAQVKFERKEIMLIVSILSPGNKWERNLNDLENFIQWSIEGFNPDSKPKFFTYGQNIEKAKRLFYDKYNYENNLNQWYVKGLNLWIKENMKAKKTYNFYLHLINPEDKNAFTIDRHMLKICGIESLSITPKQYDILKDIYLQVFQDYQSTFKNLANFQAVLWANYVFQKRGILHY